MAWDDFDDQELGVMCALFDTLIPPDDYPGGWEGGVALYLESAFQSELRPYVPQYKELIKTLGQQFVQIPHAERIGTLNSMEKQLINLVASHAAEGYYAAPGPGWEMIGFKVTS
jgi:hypothetical protein